MGVYMGTSLTRNTAPLVGPNSGTMPRALWWSGSYERDNPAQLYLTLEYPCILGPWAASRSESPEGGPASCNDSALSPLYSTIWHADAPHTIHATQYTIYHATQSTSLNSSRRRPISRVLTHPFNASNARARTALQGYLAYKKTHPPRTLP